MKKKTILLHSNSCKAFTGFGKNQKNILKYLYNTGKYNVIEAANMKMKDDPELDFLPWKCYGTIPKNHASLPAEQKQMAGYGFFEIDEIVKIERPDVYIGVEDIWAFTNFHHKPWWNKVNSMIWTTLDSLPILPQAIQYAPKIKNYYVWSSFAEKAFKKIGYDNVKTLRGSLDTNNFYKLSDNKKSELREKNSINKKDFIVGFVFRNQLRKSVPNILDGFKTFNKDNPNSKLLLHTHWGEGWDILRLINEKEINKHNVLTTYFCSSCNNYEIKSFSGQELECPSCKNKTSNTANVKAGVSEKQLNEIYNLMDVYCHPFTSGGQEIPVQEAKLVELITLVTDYSCGEDSCSDESGGIPLDWHEYREPGTQFIKASTDAKSIHKQLQHVYDMSEEERSLLGIKSRNWVVNNFSIEVIGSQLEKIIDDMPFLEDDVDIENVVYNELYEMKEHLENGEFIIDLYKNILNDDVDENTDGYKKWLSDLDSGSLDKNRLYHHFIEIAKKENLNKPVVFEDLLSKDDEGQRIAVVVPESGTDLILINSLMKNLKRKHKGYNIYVFTKLELFEYIEDNPNVYKCLQYSQVIDNPISMEGFGENKGFFEAAYYPTATTQITPCYIHNGK